MKFPLSKPLQQLCAGAASVLCLSALPVAAQTEQILFDDFSYTNNTQLTNNGWRLRTWSGGPGLANGTWSENNISFVTDPASPSNKFMRLKAGTNINGSTIANNNSTSGSVSQAEVARTEQIYKNGTWAARMYFNDSPSTGADGDTVIQTFFGLTDYIEGAEPYSEIDFEYLPNGGWWTGSATPSMWSGTYRIVDWSDESNHGVTRTQGSLQGWHTLVMQVQDGHIAFYIDGNYQTSFSGAVAPDYPMYLMFQLWFSNDCFDAACNTHGYINNSNYREYYEDVDWVYFEKNNIVSPTLIPQKVANLRAAGTSYIQNINGNSTSSIPASSTPASSSSAAAQQCNWWGTLYPICTHISSGWGWQNNADCVGIQTCQTLSPPYGVVGATASSSSRSSTPQSSSRASSSAAPFTRLIQAESYSVMSGVQLETTTDSGGGQNVGWIDTGDWMSYANINFPTSGTYKVEYRVASPTGSALSLDLNAGAIQLGQVTIPATGGWQNWTTVSHNVQVTAGTYSVGIYAPQSGWNVNWLRITKI
ncbi:carbohydrate-binding protein [Cellvibrio sp. UBA7661]|uniref:carbohydrate-binding protein n=1 Tax=Cellvibrio sp. UBA7661 TaxID=1946311 RepID=UPI002F360991